jgi:aspartyl protease family protein
MRWGPVIMLFASVGAAAWLAPSLRTEPVHAAVDASPSKTQGPAWDADETVIERESDGHFYAEARVDSHPTRFLVDTGASIVALTGEDAQAAGLTWSEGDMIEIGRGASGSVYGVPVRLERVELGGFEAQDVEAAIVPTGLDVSLLGQSFLTRVKGLRIEDDRMVVGGET